MNTQQKIVSATPARTNYTQIFPRMSTVRRDGGSPRYNFRPPPIVEINVNRGVVFGGAEVALNPKHFICRYATGWA